MKNQNFLAIVLFFTLSICFCGVIEILDGKYYYSPWGASVNKGCRSIMGLVSGAFVAVASQKSELEIAGTKITQTINNYSDTTCATLTNTIVAKSTLTTVSSVQTKIIYLDTATAEYKSWTAQPISALTINIAYDTATLTCNASSCDLATISNNCATGSLSNGGTYDYTSCQFASQPKTLYTLAYRSNLNELMFGTSHGLTTDTVTSYAGDTAASRYKYIYANESYILK